MIDSFSGEYRFLSNFWMCPVEFDGHVYSSVEHAFVAAKTHDEEFRSKVRMTQSPAMAKRMGRTVKLRPDWDLNKRIVMYTLVSDKFRRNHLLGMALVGTGDEELVEGNTWGDRYWGVCDGVGENWLGKTLMQVRKELAREYALEMPLDVWPGLTSDT